jgi:hypothetical protein
VTTEADRYGKGRRVQAHPATDAWMMGDRYGVIVGRTLGRMAHEQSRGVRVRMDRSQQIRTFRPGDLLVEYQVQAITNPYTNGEPSAYWLTVFAVSSGNARQVVLDKYPHWETYPMTVRLK